MQVSQTAPRCLTCDLMCFLREEEGEKREADLRREMEEKERQHREMIEKLQIQVRGGFSVLEDLFT